MSIKNKPIFLNLPVEFLTIKEVNSITKLSRSTIYKLLKTNNFPQPKRIGRSIRWRLSDIENFVNSQGEE